MSTLHPEAQISVASTSQSPFELIKKTNSTGQEIWSARELQKVLEYSTWQKFEKAILAVKDEFEFENLDLSANFDLTYRASQSGKNTTKQITDYELSRFFCYKLAMRGETDACKKSRTYFAVQTRKQELAPAPQATNQFDFLRSMLDNLENQAKEIVQIKYEVQELKETPRIVNLEMKNLTQLKGFRQMQKNEVGSSINKCVEKIGKIHGFRVILDPDFPTDMKKAKYILNTGEEVPAGEFFAKQHHFCHELYSAGAETYYSGADSATLEEKEQYRIWLNNYLAKNSSRLV